LAHHPQSTPPRAIVWLVVDGRDCLSNDVRDFRRERTEALDRWGAWCAAPRRANGERAGRDDRGDGKRRRRDEQGPPRRSGGTRTSSRPTAPPPRHYKSIFTPNRHSRGGMIVVGCRNVEPEPQLMFDAAFEFDRL